MSTRHGFGTRGRRGGFRAPRATLTLIAGALLLMVAMPTAAVGAPGDLDPAFDGDGRSVYGFGDTVAGTDDFALDIARQPDGKLVAAGYSDGNFAAARYEPDGSLDTSFGDGGLATADLGGADFGHAVAIQPDGGIVVAGRADEEGSNDFGVVRFAADGSLDPTFSGDGKRKLDLGGADSVDGVALQADGKIVVAGGSVDEASFSGDFAVARFRAGGAPDGSFSGDGWLTTDLGQDDYAHGIEVQADGALVVTGDRIGVGSDFALARYEPDGTLDDTFSGDGIQITDFGGVDFGWRAAIQPDGRIAVAGVTDANGTDDFALARFDTVGELDDTFSGDGKQVTDLGGQDFATGVEVQADGKLVAVGDMRSASDADFALARYDADGTLDDSFGDAGTTTTDFGAGESGVAAVIGPDGTIAAAGGTQDVLDQDFALALYDGAGQLDPGFGGDGMVTTNFAAFTIPSADTGLAAALQPDGRIVVTGTTTAATGLPQFGITRLLPDGSLDPSFGAGGVVRTAFGNFANAYAVAIQPDGKIVAAGDTATDFAVARYNPDGSLDPTFGAGGRVTTNLGGVFSEAHGVAIQPDGRIVLAGLTAFDFTAGFALARYEPDGDLDPTFSEDGIQQTGFPGYGVGLALGLAPDGRMTVAGVSDDVFTVARYQTDGALDKTFAGDGIATTEFRSFGQAESVSVLPDASVVAAGLTEGIAGNVDFALARFAADGSLDPSFAGNGKQTTDFGGFDRAFGLGTDGDRVVVGGLTDAGEGLDFGLARYRADGELDPAFSGDGLQITDFGGADAARAIAIQPDGRSIAAGSTGLEGEFDFAVARHLGGAATAGPPPAPAPDPAASRTCAGRTATITGTEGADRIDGTPRRDVVVAGGGADRIRGMSGADIVCAGPGSDSLRGGAGADLLRGGPGRDTLRGGAGRDWLRGGPGRDRTDEGKGGPRDRPGAIRERGGSGAAPGPSTAAPPSTADALDTRSCGSSGFGLDLVVVGLARRGLAFPGTPAHFRDCTSEPSP